jgi:hypothetical protein
MGTERSSCLNRKIEILLILLKPLLLRLQIFMLIIPLNCGKDWFILCLIIQSLIYKELLKMAKNLERQFLSVLLNNWIKEFFIYNAKKLFIEKLKFHKNGI